MLRYTLGKQRMPLFAVVGELREVLKPDGTLFVVVGTEQAVKIVAELNALLDLAARIPPVLHFDGKQSSISTLRALKHLDDTLKELAMQVDETASDSELDARQVALDDLELLISSVRSS